jgi:hypothetical protein
VLAGGGLRIAWQAGVVRALHEEGLTFDHGDGTSGGIFTLGMLLSGVAPDELGARWRTLDPKRSISLLPLWRYLWPTSLPAFGDADGLVEEVFPHLGIDIDRIRASSGMTGTFNVADFTSKTCVAIPQDQIDLPRMTAGVSLPVFLPAVEANGRIWTDAVWIKDANLLEAVRRGCTELWLAWCIGNAPYWGDGALEQYVHMIELSANGSLFEELAAIEAINARRRAGEPVHGTTEPVVVHVVKPAHPLPLDPDFIAGRITAETLVAMGYRDARRYLAHRPPAGVGLDPSATSMAVAPLGARLTVRAEPAFDDGGSGLLHLGIELTDLERLGSATVVGRLAHPSFGDALLHGGRVGRVGRRLDAAADVSLPDGPATVEVTIALASGEVAVVVRRGASPVATGRATLSILDRARLAWSFEPSGAHGLGDRWTALRRTVAALRRP